VVAESFADPLPQLSLCPDLPLGLAKAGSGAGETVVLRSFGKFYGLAGLRLGFALGSEQAVAQLRAAAGPWPVSGPALAVAARALPDTAWRREMIGQLAQDAARLDGLCARAGWAQAGGTTLFRLYRTPDAARAQRDLARQRIWTRRFPWSPDLLRLGLPGPEAEWTRCAAALERLGAG